MSQLTVFYLFVMSACLGQSSTLLMILSVEILSWMFSFLMPLGHSFKYLLLQSVFVFIALFGALYAPMILISGFMLKLGLPPFHVWMFYLVSFLKKDGFLFFMTLHKLVPILVLVKVLSAASWIVFMWILVILGILMTEISSLLAVFVTSSMAQTMWMVASAFLSLWMTLVYWCLYSMMMMLFFFSMPFSSALTLFSSSQGTMAGVVWLALSGLPPLTMFFMKVNVLFPMSSDSLFLVGLIMLVSVVSLFLYFRVFHTLVSGSGHQAQALKTVFPLSFMFFW